MRRHLVRCPPLDLAQHEHHPLLLGQALGQTHEDLLHLLAREARLVAALLADAGLPQVMEHAGRAALAAATGAQQVDRDVGGDAEDPGVGLPPRVVLAAALPDAQQRDLDHVAGFLEVAEDAVDDLEQRLGLARHQLVEGERVVVAQTFHQRDVVLFRPAGAGASLGVSELWQLVSPQGHTNGCERHVQIRRLTGARPGRRQLYCRRGWVGCSIRPGCSCS